MLLAGGKRAVIEVDGKQHYADSDGKANPRLYSEMVAEDRRLRLSGYEVYRFGGYELSVSTAEETVVEFFRRLLHM
jgi:very-short-patch-repair endonuclease